MYNNVIMCVYSCLASITILKFAVILSAVAASWVVW